MKTKLFTPLLLLFLFLHCSNNDTKFETKKNNNPDTTGLKVKDITKLPKRLDETSGLVFFNNYFWTINDSGGKASLYAFDKKSGKIKQYLKIIGGLNVDWEDLAQDENYIYIADTGNNAGKRKEFQIYKVAKTDILKVKEETGKVNAEKIVFSFSPQPENLETHNHNYDIESLVVVDGRIMFFTKNWADRKSSCYEIKNGVAHKVKSYNPKGLLTGAYYDKKNNRILAVGYHKYAKVYQKPPFLMIINDFNTVNESIEMHTLSGVEKHQIESVCLVNDRIFITNEGNKYAKQSLKEIILPKK